MKTRRRGSQADRLLRSHEILLQNYAIPQIKLVRRPFEKHVLQRFAPGARGHGVLDILAGSFTVCDTLTFTVDVAGSLDALPNPPGAGGAFFWNFGLNSHPFNKPSGLPGASRANRSARVPRVRALGRNGV